MWTDIPSYFINAAVSINETDVTVNTGGTSGCTIVLTSANDNGQSYFDVAKNVSSHTFTNIDLLQPYNVTITKHNYIPYLGYVCTTTNLINQTISSNTTVAGCNINVQNVTVANGAKLTLEAPGTITINGPFQTVSGTQLQVK
jgi:hypothetical protein